MTNTLEVLISLNKKFIMNSKFQNTMYKNQKLCEYLRGKSNTVKPGDDFNSLIYHLIGKLPDISYELVMKYRHIYEKHPNLYLRFIGEHNYLLRVQDFLDHIDAYEAEDEIPVSFYLPSFFPRSYKIVFLNKITNIKTIKAFPLKYGMWNECKAQKIFLYLIKTPKSYREILENVNWLEYTGLIKDLKQVGYIKTIH